MPETIMADSEEAWAEETADAVTDDDATEGWQETDAEGNPVREEDSFHAQAQEEERAYIPPSLHAEHMDIESGTHLRPTTRFWVLFFIMAPLVAGAVVLGMEVGLLWAGITGALAVLLIGYTVFSVLATRAAIKRVYVDAERTLSKDKLRFGHPVQVTLDLTRSRFPYPLRVRIRERPSPGFAIKEPVLLKGAERVEYEAIARQSGRPKFLGIEVSLGDRRGLWKQRRTYTLVSEVEVEMGMRALALRSQVTSATPFQDGTPKALVHMFRDVEHELTHEYGPGDRLKDVDWKRVAITGEMIVRENISENISSGLLLIDCGTSMSIPHQGLRPLDYAVEFSREIIKAAVARNVNIGVLAFNDTMALDRVKPSRSRRLPVDIEENFAYFSDPKVGELDEQDPARRMLREQELSGVLAQTIRMAGGKDSGIILFSDLDSINEDVIAVVRKAAQSGVKVGVVLLPHPTLAQKRALRMKGFKPPNGFRGKKVRKELREVLVAQDVEFLDYRNIIEEDLKEIADEIAGKVVRKLRDPREPPMTR